MHAGARCRMQAPSAGEQGEQGSSSALALIGQSSRTSNDDPPTFGWRWTGPHQAGGAHRTSPKVTDRSVLKPSPDRPVDRQRFALLVLLAEQPLRTAAQRVGRRGRTAGLPSQVTPRSLIRCALSGHRPANERTTLTVSGLWDSKTQLALGSCLAYHTEECTRRPMAWGRAPNPVLTQPLWSVMAAQ